MLFLRMEQLWTAAAPLPPRKVRLRELPGFDAVRWFGGPLNLRPTCRAVAEHARDIFAADLNYPIILSPSGEVLDGMHRICKAFLSGLEEIDAVHLPQMPAYRWRLLPTNEEVPFPEDAGAK
jgi:hypothetical protein